MEVKMEAKVEIRVEDLRPGNLIGYDHKEHPPIPKPMMIGWVERIDEQGRIVFKNGAARKPELCTGVQITREWLLKNEYKWGEVGIVHSSWVNTCLIWHNGWRIYGPDGVKTINYVHELQNFNEDIKII